MGLLLAFIPILVLVAILWGTYAIACRANYNYLEKYEASEDLHPMKWWFWNGIGLYISGGLLTLIGIILVFFQIMGLAIALWGIYFIVFGYFVYTKVSPASFLFICILSGLSALFSLIQIPELLSSPTPRMYGGFFGLFLQIGFAIANPLYLAKRWKGLRERHPGPVVLPVILWVVSYGILLAITIGLGVATVMGNPAMMKKVMKEAGETDSSLQSLTANVGNSTVTLPIPQEWAAQNAETAKFELFRVLTPTEELINVICAPAVSTDPQEALNGIVQLSRARDPEAEFSDPTLVDGKQDTWTNFSVHFKKDGLTQNISFTAHEGKSIIVIVSGAQGSSTIDSTAAQIIENITVE